MVTTYDHRCLLKWMNATILKNRQKAHVNEPFDDLNYIWSYVAFNLMARFICDLTFTDKD